MVKTPGTKTSDLDLIRIRNCMVSIATSARKVQSLADLSLENPALSRRGEIRALLFEVGGELKEARKIARRLRAPRVRKDG